MINHNRKVKRHIISLFLDSGAHSLFNEHSHQVAKSIRYEFFNTQQFWDYVDRYAYFVKANKQYLDYYVNVDVIHNPEKTWEVQKYLEQEYGLHPLPVVHAGTPLKWISRYLEGGYKYLGIGGVALEGTKDGYLDWADSVYSLLCPPPSYLPIIKTHGFAMTDHTMLTRYPFWSVDSASWAKAAAFGSVFIPHKRRGQYTFATAPHVVCFSQDSPQLVAGSNKCFERMSNAARSVVIEWLDFINIPLGKSNGKEIIELGVINHYGTRSVANMRFFQELCKWLPKWPWPFPYQIDKGLGL